MQATCYATFPHGNTPDSTGQFAALQRSTACAPTFVALP